MSLTTSFTVDILNGTALEEKALARTRSIVHVAMALTMGVIIILFHILSEEDAISAVYTLASYTYGPILGLFVFGMFCRRQVNDRLVPAVCIAAPILCYVIKESLHTSLGYVMSFELLILNAALTCVGLAIMSRRPRTAPDPAAQST